jgi:hypothetical protein
VAKVARALGLPPMPWQLYTATVGGEVNACGRYVYPLLIVSVPRQSGKSALMLAQAVHRCLQAPDREVWFTAQTGKDATDLYRKFVGRVMKSPLRELVAGKPAFRAGNECLTFVNGSTLRPFSPGRDALHGKQSDHVSIDEGWSFDEAHGMDLFQAVGPTQVTRPGAQTWVWSTRGDALSVWFHGLVARGQAGDPDVALFDWGIPAGAPVDLETIVAHHPAVGHTQTRDSLRAAQASLGNKPAEYARAYGNRATGGKELVIPADAWNAARTTEPLPPGVPAYGIAVYEPRDGGDVTGALYAAAADEAGRPVLELLEHRPGRAWLAPAVLRLRDRGQGVAVVRGGPAGPVADALELAGVELLELSGIDYANACQDFRDRIADDAAREQGPRLLHRDSEDLDNAIDVAGRRFVVGFAEGAWVWSVKDSTGDIAALQAATVAAWAVARAEPARPLGRSVFLA